MIQEYKKTKNRKSLYHYCSLDSFISIIENSSFRIYDVSKSNDAQEGYWFMDSLTKKILQFMKENKNDIINLWGKHYDEIFEFINKRIDIYTKSIAKTSLHGFFYVGCFTRDKDLLSQWVKYADDGRGISLGFNTNYISAFCYEDIDYDAPTYFEAIKLICKVIKIKYNKQILNERIEEYCCDFFNSIKESILINDDISKLRSTIVSEFMVMYEESIEYKNPSFKEEKEWRICAQRYPFEFFGKTIVPIENNVSINELFLLSKPYYVSKNNKLVSYLDVKFKKKLFINNIVIGPKAKVTIEDINLFLLSQGYPDINVEYSNSSYS